MARATQIVTQARVEIAQRQNDDLILLGNRFSIAMPQEAPTIPKNIEYQFIFVECEYCCGCDFSN